MMQNPGEVFSEIYKLETEFNSKLECESFVANPYTNAVIKDHILTIYPLRPVDKVFCVREDRWNDFIGREI
jgi:hypothetical protein